MPQYDQAVLLVNSSKYGGSGGWLATASLHSEAPEIVLHEVGHSFADLGDEYWAGAMYASEKANRTKQTNMSKLVWKNWHGDNNVGLYPHSESPDWYRPHQNCKMRYLGKDFCSVCIEAIAEKIHTLAPSLLAHAPISKSLSHTGGSLDFSLDLLEAQPSTLDINWTLNGQSIELNKKSINLNFDQLKSGGNQLAVVVEDKTDLVRTDGHTSIHASTVNWTIERSATTGIAIQSDVAFIEVKMFHDAVQQSLNFSVGDSFEKKLKVELINVKGVKLKALAIPENKKNIDISDLKVGAYILKIFAGKQFLSSRVIKIADSF